MSKCFFSDFYMKQIVYNNKIFNLLHIILFCVFIVFILYFVSKNISNNKIDDSLYLGVFLDEDVNEPNLIISKNEDGTYSIELGIFRLASFEDRKGKLTKDGMEFKAIDPSGKEIKGIIIVNNKVATVKFTDSTWRYIKNGDEFKYHRN